MGKTVFLHMGQRLLLSRRKVSTHSGWKMWWQGSSRTMVPDSLVEESGATKSSRQIAQVGWEKAPGW